MEKGGGKILRWESQEQNCWRKHPLVEASHSLKEASYRRFAPSYSAIGASYSPQGIHYLTPIIPKKGKIVHSF